MSWGVTEQRWGEEPFLAAVIPEGAQVGSFQMSPVAREPRPCSPLSGLGLLEQKAGYLWGQGGLLNPPPLAAQFLAKVGHPSAAEPCYLPSYCGAGSAPGGSEVSAQHSGMWGLRWGRRLLFPELERGPSPIPRCGGGVMKP